MRPRFVQRHLDPTRTVVLSFAAVIAAGTLLLSLPVSAAPGRAIRVIDALFMAASATCVTGLAVFDIGTELSLFGQLVLLGCIQVGGLGLMTFTTVFLVTTGRRLAIGDRVALTSSFHHSATDSLARLIRYIVLGTLAAEAAGAALLSLHWIREGRFAGVADTVYHAVFLSISAFCNAGFGLASDSLTGFRDDPVVVVVISLLIVFGGIGFLVSVEVARWLQERVGRVLSRNGVVPRVRLSVHAKLALTTTAALLILGTPAFFLLEREGALAGMRAPMAWLNAWFCAVTPRTAGFNTVSYAQLGGSTILLTMVLMIIGASPGSTGGGIKTTTFGLLVAYAVSRWRGHTRLHLFNRTVSQESVDKASAVVISAVGLLVVACMVLVVTETGGPRGENEDQRLVWLIFEAISAFGTVGLSMGATSQLTDIGKLIIVGVMFAGRVGPLTLALAIARRRRRAQYRYAEENVMIG